MPPLCWDGDSVWGLQGDPVAVGAAGTWRQLRSSRCVSATDGAGTEGSTGRSVGGQSPAGEPGTALSSRRNEGAHGSEAAHSQQRQEARRGN